MHFDKKSEHKNVWCKLQFIIEQTYLLMITYIVIFYAQNQLDEHEFWRIFETKSHQTLLWIPILLWLYL